LINAVKDVASALGELISATKNASGKTAQDPAMSMLKDSAKVCDLRTPPSGKRNNYTPISVCGLWCFSLTLYFLFLGLVR